MSTFDARIAEALNVVPGESCSMHPRGRCGGAGFVAYTPGFPPCGRRLPCGRKCLNTAPGHGTICFTCHGETALERFQGDRWRDRKTRVMAASDEGRIFWRVAEPVLWNDSFPRRFKDFMKKPVAAR